MKYLARSISVLAAALVWTFVAVWIVRILSSLYERYFLNRIDSSFFEGVWWPSWLLAAALVLGCATAWRIAREEPILAEARTQRSALSVWPGWPLAIVGIIAADAALLLLGEAPGRLQVWTVQLLDDYTFATVPLTLAAAAAATGGRGRGAAALLAAPMMLIVCFGLVAETSIMRLSAAACLPAVALAAGFAALAQVTGRETFVWLAIGFASVVLIALLLATGLFTPSEALGVVGALAVAIGLLVYTLIDRGFPWRVFTIGATEILAAGAVLVFGTLASLLLRLYGAPAPVTILPGAGLELIAVAAMLVGGFVITPLLTISLVPLLLVVAPQMFGQTGIRAGTLLVLAGVAAMLLRSIDWTPSAEIGTSLRLPRTVGLIAAATLLAVVVLTMVFWPAIETVVEQFVG